MLQTAKKPIALLCAVLMCITLLSGIAVPVASAAGTATTDAYAKLHEYILDNEAEYVANADAPAALQDSGLDYVRFVPAGKSTAVYAKLDPAGNSGKNETLLATLSESTEFNVLDKNVWCYGYANNSNKYSATTLAADVLDENGNAVSGAEQMWFITFGNGTTVGDGKTYILTDNRVYSSFSSDISGNVNPQLTAKGEIVCFCLPGSVQSGSSYSVGPKIGVADTDKVYVLGARAGQSAINSDGSARATTDVTYESRLTNTFGGIGKGTLIFDGMYVGETTSSAQNGANFTAGSGNIEFHNTVFYTYGYAASSYDKASGAFLRLDNATTHVLIDNCYINMFSNGTTSSYNYIGGGLDMTNTVWERHEFTKGATDTSVQSGAIALYNGKTSNISNCVFKNFGNFAPFFDTNDTKKTGNAVVNISDCEFEDCNYIFRNKLTGLKLYFNNNTMVGAFDEKDALLVDESSGARTGNFDLSDNAFLDASGKAYAVPTAVTKNVKATDYYVDAERTIKASSLFAVKGNFAAIDTEDACYPDWKVTLSAPKGTDLAASDIKVASGVTVDSLIDDATSEAFTGATVGDDPITLTLTASKNGHSAESKVEIVKTFDLPWAKVWNDNGLAPNAEGEVFEVQTTQSTGNSVMFVANDWLDYAMDTPDGEPGEVQARSETLENQMPLGYTFYATMPTTGITYKLKYGINAANVLNINTGIFNKLVLFPGSYSKTAYPGTSTVTADGVTSCKGFSATAGIGAFAIAHSSAYNSGGPADIVVLGPKAGIAAGDTTNGNASSARSIDTDNEAVFTSNYIYLMNAAFYEGRTTTFDGLAATGGNYICSFYGNADRFTKNEVNATIAFNNFLVKDNTNHYFCLWNYVDGVTNSNTKYPYGAKTDTAKLSLSVDINDSYIEAPSAKRMGEFIADNLRINRSVLYNKSTNVDTDAINGTIGFLVQPTSPNYHTEFTDCEYSITDSYVKSPASAVIGVYWNYATGCTSANRSVKVAANNNIFDNCSLNAANESRSHIIALYTAPTLDDFTIEYTGNTAINDTVESPTRGHVFYGKAGANNIIKNNTFIGYKKLFTGYTDDNDVSENLYYNFDNELVVAPANKGKVSDVMLGDFEHKASDLDITYNGIAADVVIPAKGTVVPTAFDGDTITLIPGTPINTAIGKAAVGANAKVLGLFEDDKETTATSIVAGNTYYLQVGFKDDCPYTVYYPAAVDIDISGATEWTGGVYYDEAVTDKGTGMHAIYNIGGVDYYFTVGTNLFANFSDIPTSVTTVNLFAKEYTSKITVSNSARANQTLKLLGAKAGVSPIVAGADDKPTNMINPNRGSGETIIKDFRITSANQIHLTVDGVTFAGENAGILDSSSYTAGNVSEVHVLNCIANGVTINEGSAGLVQAKTDCSHNIEFKNNYFNITLKSGTGIAVLRDLASLSISNNYLASTGTGYAFYLDTVAYGKTASRSVDNNMEITGNTLGASIVLETMSFCDSATLNINNNKFTEATNNAMIRMGTGSLNNDTDGAEHTIIISDNTFTAGTKTGKAIEINALKDPTSGSGAVRNITIEENVFDNTNGTFSYGIWNKGEDEIDASANTFKEFAYNYGPIDVLDGGVVAMNDLVSFTNGDTNAAIVIDGTTYAATDIDGAVTMADLVKSGANAIDDTTVREVLDGSSYIFNTKNAMAVKVTYTDTDGATQTAYNYIPADASDVEIAIVNFAGQDIGGDTFTFILNDAPFVLTMIDSQIEDVINPQDLSKPYATFWKGQIAVADDWDIELYGAYDIKVLDYGMFYSNVEGEDAAEFEYVNGIYKDSEGKTRAKMVSYNDEAHKDGDYLKQVYQKYSFRFNNIGYEKYRYGKLYLAYTIGESDVIHYAYSEAAELTTPVAQ